MLYIGGGVKQGLCQNLSAIVFPSLIPFPSFFFVSSFFLSTPSLHPSLPQSHETRGALQDAVATRCTPYNHNYGYAIRHRNGHVVKTEDGLGKGGGRDELGG